MRALSFSAPVAGAGASPTWSEKKQPIWGWVLSGRIHANTQTSSLLRLLLLLLPLEKCPGRQGCVSPGVQCPSRRLRAVLRERARQGCGRQHRPCRERTGEQSLRVPGGDLCPEQVRGRRAGRGRGARGDTRSPPGVPRVLRKRPSGAWPLPPSEADQAAEPA